MRNVSCRLRSSTCGWSAFHEWIGPWPRGSHLFAAVRDSTPRSPAAGALINMTPQARIPRSTRSGQLSGEVFCETSMLYGIRVDYVVFLGLPLLILPEHWPCLIVPQSRRDHGCSGESSADACSTCRPAC
ncbi:unnamed protein product [Prorocentrum cordatum]|uniref:Uncharacterized protein n=1 Tax=Prorocentrum cordatum TaxID=2364126 RepID=A0ABN9TX67_9DINO|nr:unnamed protein product [Polarella glacialis]